MSALDMKLQALQQGGFGSKKSHLKFKSGCIITNLKDRRSDVLVLPVSCFNRGHKGLIGNVLRTFPQVQKHLDSTKDSDFAKLGTILSVSIPMTSPAQGNADVVEVVLMFVQKSDNFRKEVRASSKVHIPSLEKCLNTLVELYGVDSATRISMPQIGIYGGSRQWSDVEYLLENVQERSSSKALNLTIFKAPARKG